MEKIKLDHKIIFDLIEPNSKVLDLGCGNGDLLSLLEQGKNAKGQGIELKEEAIYQCVEKGLTVFHGDIESGLLGYPDHSFDFVILNQSMQEVTDVDFIIQEALRIGRRVIIGFPNFAHIQARINLFFQGRAPISKSLPYSWHDTPNIHFLSIKDFREYCKEKKINILHAFFLGDGKAIRFFPNLFALNAIFMISRNDS